MKNAEDKNNAVPATEEESVDSIGKHRARGGRRLIIGSALVLVAVTVINLFFSLFSYDNLWFTDLTLTKYKKMETTLYTLSDSCRELIGAEAIPMIDSINAERKEEGLEPLTLDIIFCNDPDRIEEDDSLRYVLYTARALRKEFPEHVRIEFINMTKNPSAVQKYKATSAARIYETNVIVAFGSEYAVHGIRSFFTADGDSEKPWAYNGEKKLSASILSVTRAEAPICCITTNHGEKIYGSDGKISEEYTAFAEVIKGAGYEIMPLDLERDEIPEDCRMIITCDPVEDFKAFGNLGENNVSEIEKLDRYLDNAYSFFYICDRDTPALKNLEEYLEEWGITVCRANLGSGEQENYSILDDSLNVGSPDSVLGLYAEEGLGANLVGDIRKSAALPPSAVFGSGTAIAPSETYNKNYHSAEETDGAEYVSYHYFKNGVTRDLCDIFTSYDTAVATVGGKVYDMANAQKQFKLFTVTRETRSIQEDNYSTINDSSYVMALSSTEFISNELLASTSYGNTDVLLSVLRNTGKEVIPVDVEFKPFYVYDIDSKALASVSSDSALLICLAALPSLCIFAWGAVVVIRRKHR